MIDDDDFESRAERRHRKPRPASKLRKRDVAAALSAPEVSTARGFAASVQVTNTERAWIVEHLGPFHQSRLIDDVVARVKAGKEATVYACSGHPSSGRPVIAAKLYRQRAQRSSKNTSQYQQGRAVLDGGGHALRPREWRLHKAIAQGSRRGLAVTQMSWLMHEFTLLQTLHARGADVPEPIAHGEHALLMEFVGDETTAAPTLNEVALELREARQLFERVLFDIELLLELGWVHGDLSSHNILYQHGRVVLIDFPQVVTCHGNPDARSLFERDVERVAQYFSRAGVRTDQRGLARALWSKHVARSGNLP
jgi:RIO kinase 1